MSKRLFLAVIAIASLSASLLPSTAASIVYLDQATADSFAASSMPRPVNTEESTYFVFTDRYANGSEDNDYGSGLNQQGFDPADVAKYHGGDFIGLKDNLERIVRLGYNAIWITPPVLNDSNGYHGYWGLDFTTVDPHLGTEEEFQAFIDRAHELGLKVIMDIVVNHTADVIGYTDSSNSFIPTTTAPYKDASGTAFNISDKSVYTVTCSALGQSDCFPLLDPEVSFPRTPRITSESKNAKKSPEFLQDMTNYHNRGDASSCNFASGSCAMMGDFYGLDDLMTENPVVVQGLSDLYASWVTRFGIDGFRIDTAKHVNKEFFDRWVPAVNQAGQEAGKGELTIYGEAWLNSATELSQMLRKYKMQSLLDFPMQALMTGFAAGFKSGNQFKTGLAYDDYFNAGNTPDEIVRNAYGLTTFLGNHDMGRAASKVDAWTLESGAKLLARVKLANSMLFLSRGAPVTYYGDELGMRSTGANEYARQDMFPTEVDAWKKLTRIGADPIRDGSFLTPEEEQHPIAKHIRALQNFRKLYPGFVTGASISRVSTLNMVAWSRIDASTNHEFLVVANNGKTSQTMTIPVSTKASNFVGVFGTTASFKSSAKSTIKVTVPARKAIVLRAENTIILPANAPVPTLKIKANYSANAPMLTAEVTTKTPLIMTFLARATANDQWRVIGVDDNPSYRLAVDEWMWDGNASMQFAVIARTYDGKIAGGQVISKNYAAVSVE